MADVNLQLDLGEEARARLGAAADAGTAAPLLDEDSAEDDEPPASLAAASELVAAGPPFDS
jgi:hypothetical protein